MRSLRAARCLLPALLALALTVVVLPPSAEAAPAVAGRYLVITNGATSTAMRTADRLRIPVRERFRYVAHGYAADLTAVQVRTLRADTGVTRIVPDARIRVADTARATPLAIRTASTQEKPTWGLDRVDQRAVKGDQRYHYDSTGAGVIAYVVDTGVLATHRQFGGRVKGGYDFVDDDNNPADCAGHGTHVAGTIAGQDYGVAKKVTVVPLRVFDCEESGYLSDFVAALDWVVANRPAGVPAVVNYSGEGPADQFTDDAVTATVAAGVPVVVAAGNDYEDACNTSPARAAAAITVGATDRRDHEADFSNDGRCVDVFAPGVDVKSAWITSNSATAYLDGTSMATPHVTGVIARFLQGRKKDDPAAAAKSVLDHATPFTPDGPGSPHRLLYAYPTRISAPATIALTKSDRKKSITVSWTAPTRTLGTVITGYRATRTDSKGRTVTTDVAASVRRTSFGSSVAGMRYTVRVSARSALGTAAAASKSITMLAKPGQPKIGRASSGSRSDHVVSVVGRWSKPTAGGAVHRYVITVKRLSNGKITTVTRSSGARAAKVNGLKRNARYEIRVAAVNDAGTGKASARSARVTAR